MRTDPAASPSTASAASSDSIVLEPGARARLSADGTLLAIAVPVQPLSPRSRAKTAPADTLELWSLAPRERLHALTPTGGLGGFAFSRNAAAPTRRRAT